MLAGGARRVLRRALRRRAWLLWRLVRSGKPVERFDDLPQRLRAEAEIVLGQRKLFQRLVPGALHAVIFWGSSFSCRRS